MHEVSLMEQTLEVAIRAAKQEGAHKIERLKMRIGIMSGVVPDALEFAFEAVTQGTIAEGATFEIESIPVVCYCPSCQQDFQPPDFIYECPNCGRISTEARSGKEIELATLELSDFDS